MDFFCKECLQPKILQINYILKKVFGVLFLLEKMVVPLFAVVIPATEVEESPCCRQTGKDIPLLHSHSFSRSLWQIFALLRSYLNEHSFFFRQRYVTSALPFHSKICFARVSFHPNLILMNTFISASREKSHSHKNHFDQFSFSRLSPVWKLFSFWKRYNFPSPVLFPLFLTFVRILSSRYFLSGKDLAVLQSHFHNYNGLLFDVPANFSPPITISPFSENIKYICPCYRRYLFKLQNISFRRAG